MGNFDLLQERKLDVADIHKRFEIGEKSDSFNEVKKLRPVFSFDYLSLNKSTYCFDSTLLSRKDYIDILDGLKSISKNTYETINKEDRFHFHSIDWKAVNISESDFYKCVYGRDITEKDLTVYQFKVYQEARAIGFIYRSIFYLVMFDRGHNAYDRDRPKSKKVKGKKKR